MAVTQSQIVHWKQAFDETIDHYHTLKSCNVSIKGLDYSKTGGGTNSNVIHCSASDFICDVELAARRVLSDHLFEVFVDNYVDCVEDPDTQNLDIDRIRHLVGGAFCSKRIYPAAGYFKPKVIDRGKHKRRGR